MSKTLFLGKRSVSEWRVLCETTHLARFERLVDLANSYLEWLPPAEHPSESITYTGMAVANLAFAFLLTGTARYLDAARRWMEVVINYPHWGKERFPDHDLDAAWLLFGLGLAYDWIGDDLPPEEREALHDKLMLQGTRLYDFAVEQEGRWWSSAYWQNHNWICYAGLATAAYALVGEHPEVGAWSDRALENLRIVMRSLPEDGSDYEGVVYWCYGIPWILIYCDLMQQREGVDLHDSEFLRNTFYYRLYMSAPNLVNTANFGDCHDRRSAHAAVIYYRLASLYRNGHAQWLAQYFEETGEWEREGREGLLKPGVLPQAFLEFLWYDPTVLPEPIDTLPLVRVFPDLGLVGARTSWGRDATVMAFKSGAPMGRKAWALAHEINRRRGWQVIRAGHLHPDENSFILIHRDDYLAVDEGYSKAKMTRHHSTVLVDGQGQYHEGVYHVCDDLGAEWGASLVDWFAGDGVVYARGEAANAYDPQLALERFDRQILLWGDRLVVICDDLDSTETHKYEWLLQADVPAQQVAEGEFRVEADNSALRVLTLQPEPVVFESREQEIVAVPSSAHPDFVLRRPQYTLACSPVEHAESTQLLFVLAVEDADAEAIQAQPLDCAQGRGAIIDDRTLVGFADERRKVWVPGILEPDAGWVAIETDGSGPPARLAAGEATSIWSNRRLYCAASNPVSLVMADGAWHVRACQPTWVSLWSPLDSRVTNVSVTLDGQVIEAAFDPDSSLARVLIPAGGADIRFEELG